MKRIIFFGILILNLFSFNIFKQEERIHLNSTKELLEATEVEYKNQSGEPDTMYVNFNNERLTITPEGKIFKNDLLFLDLEMEDEYFQIESLYFIFEKEYIIAIYTETDMDYSGAVAKMVSLKDKKVNWTINFGGFNMSMPIYDENYIYVSTIGCICKIDYKKGKFDWKFDNLYDSGKYNSFNKPYFLNDTLLIFTSKQYDKDYPDTIVVDNKSRKIILKQ